MRYRVKIETENSTYNNGKARFLKQREQSKGKAMIHTNGYGMQGAGLPDRRCVTNIKMITLKFIYIEEDLDHQTEKMAEIHHNQQSLQSIDEGIKSLCF